MSSGPENVPGNRQRPAEAARPLQWGGGWEAAESRSRNTSHVDRRAAWTLRSHPRNSKHIRASARCPHNSALSHTIVTQFHTTSRCPLFSDNPLARDRTGAAAQWTLRPTSSWSRHRSEHDAGREEPGRDANGEWSPGDPVCPGKGRRGHACAGLKNSSELSGQGCGVRHHQKQGRKGKEQRNRTLKTQLLCVNVPPGNVKVL